MYRDLSEELEPLNRIMGYDHHMVTAGSNRLHAWRCSRFERFHAEKLNDLMIEHGTPKAQAPDHRVITIEAPTITCSHALSFKHLHILQVSAGGALRRLRAPPRVPEAPLPP